MPYYHFHFEVVLGQELDDLEGLGADDFEAALREGLKEIPDSKADIITVEALRITKGVRLP